MSEERQNLILIKMVYSVFWMIYINTWDICCNGILLIIFLSNKYFFSTSSVPGIHELSPPPFLLLYEINVFHTHTHTKLYHPHRAKAVSLSFIRGYQKNKYKLKRQKPHIPMRYHCLKQVLSPRSHDLCLKMKFSKCQRNFEDQLATYKSFLCNKIKKMGKELMKKSTSLLW